MSWIPALVIAALPTALAQLLPKTARRLGTVIGIFLALIVFTPIHNGLFHYLLNHRWEMVKETQVVRFFFTDTEHDGRRAIGFHYFLLGPDEARYVDNGELFWEEGL